MTSQTACPGNRHPAGAPARRTTIRVVVHASDPLVASSVVAMLHPTPGIDLVPEPHLAEVTVAVADSVLPTLVFQSSSRLVLISDDVCPPELSTAVEQKLIVLVSRTEATARTRLLRAITDAHEGRGDFPTEHLDTLLQGLKPLRENTLRPGELPLAELSQREAQVLRLLADGLDTGEIAEKLIYSERTVKNVLHNLLNRLNLRNRAHAVAYALRQGLV
jgi:DNA-binding NarL/FixJ family response regulator